MTAPANPRIYHITHVDNLADIIAGGGLDSDAVMTGRGGPKAAIGMNSIKERRLKMPVDCEAGTFVGEYVPFYFCPRSIMLFLMYKGNHPDLAYRGGQEPILHLEADLSETVAWAQTAGVRWAFSLSNAGASYTEFRNKLAELDQINWNAVASTDFRDAAVKEGKQAEFLLYGHFPWKLVRRIGARSPAMRDQAAALVTGAAHKPGVDVRRNWYY